MIVVGLVMWFVFAALCAYMAHQKNLNVLGYALLGFLVPIVGFVVTYAEPPRPRLGCATCGRH